MPYAIVNGVVVTFAVEEAVALYSGPVVVQLSHESVCTAVSSSKS